MRLSNNFTLKEMCKSATAVRLGIDNTPDKQEIENLKYLCQTISQPCRDEFGRINTNSGFRCKKLNDAVGSSDTSFHRLGCGQDMEAEDEEVSNFELLLWIYDNCEFTELIAEFFSREDTKKGWVHAANQKGNDRRVLKLKDKEHNYTVVTIDYLKELYG